MAKVKNWYRMDNAALIYMPARSKKWTAVFRVGAVLKEEVDPEILQQAVNDLAPRFPTMFVNICSGFFWYYFEPLNKPLKVMKENDYPCQRMTVKSKNFLVRVLYYGCRVSFEVFHVVTDGTGAMIFLNSLIKRYLELKYNIKIKPTENCFDYSDIPSGEESEDSFMKIAHEAPRKYKEKKSAMLKLKEDDEGVYNLTHGQMSVAALKAVAKSYNATIGEFLTAVLSYAVYNEIKNQRADFRNKKARKEKRRGRERPFKMSLPIDLRRKYNSATLRNFSSYKNLEIMPCGNGSLEEVLTLTKEQMGEIDKEYLGGIVSANVRHAENIFVRILPLFIKNIALKTAYALFGENLSSTQFSNLGVVKTPAEFSEYVDRLEFALGPPKIHMISASCVSFEDKLVMTIGNRSKDNRIEKLFFTTLSGLGLEVLTDTNRRECNG
jgi:NRPS condensation-like uncharacterized protein